LRRRARAEVPALDACNIEGTLSQLTEWLAAPAKDRGPIVVVVGNCPWVDVTGRQLTYGSPDCDAVSAPAMRVRHAFGVVL
jgi:hypothetical protein